MIGEVYALYKREVLKLVRSRYMPGRIKKSLEYCTVLQSSPPILTLVNLPFRYALPSTLMHTG